MDNHKMNVDIFQSLFLDVVQDITEWLPISSSGHLDLSQLLLNIKVPIFYDLILYIGTLAGVIEFYRLDLFNIVKSLFYPRKMDENLLKTNKK